MEFRKKGFQDIYYHYYILIYYIKVISDKPLQMSLFLYTLSNKLKALL